MNPLEILINCLDRHRDRDWYVQANEDMIHQHLSRRCYRAAWYSMLKRCRIFIYSVRQTPTGDPHFQVPEHIAEQYKVENHLAFSRSLTNADLVHVSRQGMQRVPAGEQMIWPMGVLSLWRSQQAAALSRSAAAAAPGDVFSQHHSRQMQLSRLLLTKGWSI